MVLRNQTQKSLTAGAWRRSGDTSRYWLLVLGMLKTCASCRGPFLIRSITKDWRQTGIAEPEAGRWDLAAKLLQSKPVQPAFAVADALDSGGAGQLVE